MTASSHHRTHQKLLYLPLRDEQGHDPKLSIAFAVGDAKSFGLNIKYGFEAVPGLNVRIITTGIGSFEVDASQFQVSHVCFSAVHWLIAVTSGFFSYYALHPGPYVPSQEQPSDNVR